MMKPSLLRPCLPWLLLPTLLGLASCNKGHDEVAAAQAAEESASLQKSNARLESEMKLLKTDLEKRHSEVLRKNDELVKANDELKSQFEQAQDQAVRVRREFEEYMAKYKTSQRAKTKGLTLPKLETTDQVVFESVVVRELTPKEVAFSHSGGIARLPLGKLPPDLQKKFLYDPEEVKSIEAAEVAGAEAVKGLTEVAGVRMLDPSRPVNPVAVRNLTNRIVAREAEIAKAEKEAIEVKKSSYGGTNIAQYRVTQLGERVGRLKNDIVALRALLDKEINGPQSAGDAAPGASGAGVARPQSATAKGSQASAESPASRRFPTPIPGQLDLERELTDEGRRDAERMGAPLRDEGVATRTSATTLPPADARERPVSVQAEEGPAEVSPRALARPVSGFDDCSHSPWLVGHNPTVSRFADRLPGETTVPPGVKPVPGHPKSGSQGCEHPLT